MKTQNNTVRRIPVKCGCKENQPPHFCLMVEKEEDIDFVESLIEENELD